MNRVNLVFDGTENYVFQEAYKALRTNIQFCGQDVRVINITSSEPGEGKSLTTLNLAYTFAELGKKVLLLDADMRKSAILGRASVSDGYVTGLSEYLSGLSTLDKCIMETQYTDLHVMIAGKYPPNPSELLNSTYFEDLIYDLREQYDYIFIDTPPLGAVIDAAIISAFCDGTILVIGDMKISRRVIRNVVDQLKRSDANLLGVVRNQAKRNQKGFFEKGPHGRRYKKYGKKYYGAYGGYGDYQ